VFSFEEPGWDYWAMGNDVVGATEYLEVWHERHAGATSALLGTMFDGAGRSSYRVLADAMLDGDEPALDLACGDGYLLGLMRAGSTCVGADRSLAELDAANRRLRQATPLVQADAARLPVVTAAFGSVSCHFALMLLQPLEVVVAELARVLRPHGLLAAMLPASPPEDPPTPWSAFRAAWRDVTTTHPVVIPPLQDDRALHHEQLASVLTDAGFTSLTIQSFSVSKRMTVGEATRALFLTYLPDLLPPAGLVQLEQTLEPALTQLAAEDGTVTFVEHADLVTARRR
jgi:ubiquinone/menaquinone biosynthesis C-methylase UbiE